MNKNLYFEDINEGMEIPTIKKNPTTQQLVKYAGASGDFYQIHYDMEYAKKNGLPGSAYSCRRLVKWGYLFKNSAT